MQLIRDRFDEKTRLRDESLFHCASGKLGVRGNFEEGAPLNQTTIRGTYINGFCDTETITYNEKLYGFPESKQTIVNLPDAQGIEFIVDGEKLVCFNEKVSNYKYELDMKNGVVKREFVYNTKKGKIKLSFIRLTSFIRQGLFVIRCKAESIDFNGKVEILSTLNGDVKNFTVSNDPRVASGSGKMLNVNSSEYINDIQRVEVETINSHRKLSTTVKNILFLNDSKVDLLNDKNNELLSNKACLDIKNGDIITLDKFAYYQEITNDEESNDILLNAINDGIDKIVLEQGSYMNDFWFNSRVIVNSKEIKQEHIDLCLYVMLCSAGKDGLTSISAKGLTGEGYEGHYFWDCETYIFPFFLYTNPKIARSLLEYRYSKLDMAKEHAKEIGHEVGALYPWRTITGSECSSYYPSGSAQYHINSDIARAFIQYWNITNDLDFLPKICEVLLETSRLWIDVGLFDKDGKFKINCVTGPDEYTCLVNNNYYTNKGAFNNLKGASRLIKLLKNTKDYEEFVSKTNFKEEELEAFDNACNNMFYPYDENLDIIKQDDSFLDKKKINLKEISKDKFPLLLHYHPLYINRYQVCKQADAVLADYQYDGLSSLTSMRTFKYYEECTTHDSSLSKCIFGNMAVKLGDLDTGKKYFIETLGTDVNDHQGNTRDGLHIANMGGCYDMVIGGFAGVRLKEESLELFPMLPDGIDDYSFSINYHDNKISVVVNSEGTIIKTNSNSDINITVYGQDIKVSQEAKLIKRICKGVIFDLDGVITDTAIYHYKAWKMIADELHVDFDEKRNEEFKGVSRKTCLEKLLYWGNIKMTENEFNETLVRKNDYYKDLLKNLTPSSILPGVVDAINTLKQNGIKVSLFSVSKNTDEILKRLEISNIFDEKVTGNTITYSKPHFEGYLQAADKMGIDPRLCLMVEDSVSGISGAKALSMKTIAVMNENKANADVCISNTQELKNIIDYL